MTIVVARQFGTRIIVVSDTMISDESAARQNVIPGRLKSVILDRCLSVAHSGPANVGLDAIRSCRHLFARHRDLMEVLAFLKSQSEREVATQATCDFLVISNLAGPAIYKIWNGTISSEQSAQWIGNPDLVSGLQQREAVTPIPDGLSALESEEYRFCNAFKQLQLEPAGQTTHGIGGFLILLLGSPYGHCYLSHAAATCWDTITVPPGLTEVQRSNRSSGMTQYTYNIHGSTKRGVGVLGAYLQQARTGYIYSPLKWYDPVRVSNTTLSEIVERTDSASREIEE